MVFQDDVLGKDWARRSPACVFLQKVNIHYIKLRRKQIVRIFMVKGEHSVDACVCKPEFMCGVFGSPQELPHVFSWPCCEDIRFDSKLN
jgi:hypothetical protein